MDEGKILSILGEHQISNVYGRGCKWFTHVKNGPTWGMAPGELLIIDGMAITCSWSKPLITGFEVKCSRSDFTGDSKWQGYLQSKMVSKLYFAAPRGLIKKSELPEQVGLCEIDADGSIRWTKKALVVNLDIAPCVYEYVVYSQLDNSVCPVHSRARRIQHFMDGVENRKKGKHLSWLLKGSLREKAEKLEEWEQSLKQREEKVHEIEKLDQYVTELLRLSGDKWEAYSRTPEALERLKQLVAQKNVVHTLDEAISDLDHHRDRLLRELADYTERHKEAVALLKGVA